ncbi:MAG: TRAP transporter TatT component family protein [Reinekea sp.]
MALAKYLFCSFALLMAGCATMQLPQNLSTAVLDSDDLQTVSDGLPSYLLLVDALTLTYPKNEQLQLTAASLNSAYAGVFIPENQSTRRKQMSLKALQYAFDAFCLHDKNACALRELDIEALAQELPRWNKEKDLPFLYTLGTAWASYIQVNSDDWLVIAELGKAEAILKQVVALQPDYELGTAQLYLGVMNSILPPSLGGKPDVARDYYEAALQAGDGKNLIIYVYYASNFARLIFDQELHDSLLNTALNLEADVPGYTLQNTFAQKLARDLLATSNDYF